MPHILSGRGSTRYHLILHARQKDVMCTPLTHNGGNRCRLHKERNLVPLPRHHSKATSAIFAKGSHQPPSLCAQKNYVLLFFIVFQVIVSQKYRIVNILVENICGENFLQEVFPTPLSRTL